MAGNFRRLAELGLVPLLAKEIGATIDAGTVSAIAVRRLTELGMIPREIRELRNQLATPALRIAKRWTEIGVSPRLARELVAQMGGAVAPTLGTLTLTGPALTQGVAASGNGLTGATAGSTITLSIAGLTVSGSGTTRTISGTPSTSGALTATETLAGATGSPKDSSLGTVAAAGTPAPAFSVQPSMSPTSGTAGSTLFTASDGTASNTTGYTRRWLLSGTAIGTGTTITPASAGSLVLEVTANGPGGSTIANSAASTVSAAAGASWSFPAVFTNGTMPVSLNQTQPSGSYTSNYSQATFEDVGTNYYVATTGNDTTGDGLSTGTAWRTIQKAIDTVATGSKINVGAGRFPNFTLASKNVSIYGVAGSTFVGDLLTEADITWGALASGRQTATLASGAVNGFVDLTLTKRTYAGQGIPQVSMLAASAAAVATRQSAGDPGVFRSTPSQLGASDARSLTGKADTDLLIWKTTAAAAFALTGTAQLFAKGITFVGGVDIPIASTSRSVLDTCRLLGASAQNMAIAGTSVLRNVVVRGCQNLVCDLVDYGGTATMVEVDCFMDQCNNTGSDNCSTIHGGLGLRINGTYLDASRSMNDNGSLIVGAFGCTVQADPVAAGAFSMGIGNQGYCEGHYAGITFLSIVGNDFVITPVSDATAGAARAYFYDNSLSGKKVSDIGGLIYDRTGAKPVSDTTLFKIDPSNLATLFQTSDTSTPVTTNGQPVIRVNNAANTNEYALVTGGTYTYQTDGTLHWLQTGTANTGKMAFIMNTTVIDETSNVLWAIKSSDTTGILGTTGAATNSIGDYRSTVLTGAATKPGFTVALPGGTPTYHVDGSNTPTTTGTALRAAAFNNAGHVITARAANMSWLGWHNATAMFLQYDGNLYGFETSRATNLTNLRARETALAAKCGATLV